jgi:ATP-binding cassette subfamily B protein
MLMAALFLASAGVIVEALLVRGLFDLSRELSLYTQRLAAMGLLLAFMAGLLLLEWPTKSGVLRMGRRLEARLRIAFMEKIPRLRDRYFQSRPISDMADRSHRVHELRNLPHLGELILKSGFQLVLTTAGIIWLAPSSAPLAVSTAALALAWPLLTQPLITERDLRVQTHGGGLARFYLDAMLGIVAVRTHGAEQSVRREHEGLLVEWVRAGLRLQRALVGVEGVQLLLGFGLAAWILFGHIGQEGEAGAVLLLVYWALNLPLLGEELAHGLRAYPTLRNTTLRLLEPLGALEADGARPAPPDARPVAEPAAKPVAESSSSPSRRGVALFLEDVHVKAGGHTILDGVNLDVPPGSHIAIVGASGAGKSSLVGLLLGWHRPGHGRLLVDGEPMDEARLEALRRQTAWIDPAVQLWNTSLINNLSYATNGVPGLSLGQTVELADLRDVLKKMPDGLQTRLGEGGSRVSGGEGQRVRFGRTLMQAPPRLVILDEPFRGLDHASRRELLDRARTHWQDATLLCITHDVTDTSRFPRVVVVDRGRIVEDDAPGELMRRRSKYRSLILQEKMIHEKLWGHHGWRRIHLEDGHLTEKQLRTLPPAISGILPESDPDGEA